MFSTVNLHLKTVNLHLKTVNLHLTDTLLQNAVDSISIISYKLLGELIAITIP